MLSYLNFASAGPAFPESYTHQDGATYRGQWDGLKKHGVGTYKSSNCELNFQRIVVLGTPVGQSMKENGKTMRKLDEVFITSKKQVQRCLLVAYLCV